MRSDQDVLRGGDGGIALVGPRDPNGVIADCGHDDDERSAMEFRTLLLRLRWVNRFARFRASKAICFLENSAERIDTSLAQHRESEGPEIAMIGRGCARVENGFEIGARGCRLTQSSVRPSRPDRSQRVHVSECSRVAMCAPGAPVLARIGLGAGAERRRYDMYSYSLARGDGTHSN